MIERTVRYYTRESKLVFDQDLKRIIVPTGHKLRSAAGSSAMFRLEVGVTSAFGGAKSITVAGLTSIMRARRDRGETSIPTTMELWAEDAEKLMIALAAALAEVKK